MFKPVYKNIVIKIKIIFIFCLNLDKIKCDSNLTYKEMFDYIETIWTENR
jgi:hypothetical protein